MLNKLQLAVFFVCSVAGLTTASDFPRSLEFKKSITTVPLGLQETFRKFLQRSLDADGTQVRDILVSASIIPLPPNHLFSSLKSKEIYQIKPSQIPFNDEVREHFKNHIQLILNSEVDFVNALNRILKEFINEFEIKNEVQLYPREVDSSDFLTSDAKDEKFEDTAKNYELTTDYINFLTDDAKHYIKSTIKSETSEEKLDRNLEYENYQKTEPITSDYISYLESEISKDERPTEFPLGNKLDIGVKVEDVIPVEFITVGSPIESIIEQTDSSEQIESLNEDSSLDKLKYWIETDSNLDQSGIERVVFRDIDFDEENESLDLFNTEHAADSYAKDVLSDNLQNWVEKASTHQNQIVGKEIYQQDFVVTESYDSHFSEKSRKDERANKLYLVSGTPGIHFPIYDDIPKTSFTCINKPHIPGFYADMETSCQVFHVCWPGRRESFLCPVGTTFNQALLACDYWYNSNCPISSAYEDVNAAFKKVHPSEMGTTSTMDTLIQTSPNGEEEMPSEAVPNKKEIDDLYKADVHFAESLAKSELSEIWKFLPVKVKVFVMQPPELQESLSKLREQKFGRRKTEAAVLNESGDTASDGLAGRENIKSNLLRVLKELAPHSYRT